MTMLKLKKLTELTITELGYEAASLRTTLLCGCTRDTELKLRARIDEYEAEIARRIETPNTDAVRLGWAQGVADALGVLATRRAHYALYACECVPTNGVHSRECDAMPMRTNPLTFAVIDELITMVQAMHERGGRK